MSDELDTASADEAMLNLRAIRNRVKAVARAFDESLDTRPRSESILELVINSVDMYLSNATPEDRERYYDELREDRDHERRLLIERMREAAAIGRRNRGEE